MKKTLLIFICSILLMGCASTIEINNTGGVNTSMFVIIEESSDYVVVYHRETRVMYAVSYGGYNCGNFTLLVNADGTPMLYKGESK